MNTRAGYVTIIGKPNAGKSTLMNCLIGEKLSIVTSKPQTTRKKILSILTENNSQAIFLDTPGLLESHYLLQTKMMEHVDLAIKDADILIIMLDISNDPDASKLMQDSRIRYILGLDSEESQNRIFVQAKTFLVVNKLDISTETILNKLMSRSEITGHFDDCFPISALNGFNTDKLKSAIMDNLPEHPYYFPEDQFTDESERFYTAEIIREKIFEYYKEEIPFSCEVVIDDFKEQPGRKDMIYASIIAERESQKPILIGIKGENLRRVGASARKDIEEFLGRPVYLDLRVKVKPKWRNSPEMLKRFGYDTEND